MRINRFLASCGLGSRRRMDELVASGRVLVNGRPVEGPGAPIDPRHDRVTVDGQAVRLAEELAVFLLNKPTGYLTTMDDPEGRPTVRAFLAHQPLRLFPIGRLDMDSAGLLLFTNDGKLAHRLAHPRFGVEKEYRVLARGPLVPEARRLLEEGVTLEEGITSPARVSHPRLTARGFSLFRITLHEGWNRQVRRMCAAVGLEVLRLTRIRYGFLTLEGLHPGSLRRLGPDEEKRLRALVAGPPPPPGGRKGGARVP